MASKLRGLRSVDHIPTLEAARTVKLSWRLLSSLFWPFLFVMLYVSNFFSFLIALILAQTLFYLSMKHTLD